MKVFKHEQPDYVIHHAAQVNVNQSLIDPYLDAQVNILGTINILTCCVKYKVKKIIYASSAAVYGQPMYLPADEKHPINPISFYGISKYSPEFYIQAFSQLYGLKYAILRYANVYGIRQDPKNEGGVIAIFIDKLLNRIPPNIFGNGNQTRDFIYVLDVVSANIAALSNGDNEIFNISSNSQTTVNKLVELINKILCINITPKFFDPRKGDIDHSYLENKKARELLQWKPQFPLYDGLQKTIQYYIKSH